MWVGREARGGPSESRTRNHKRAMFPLCLSFQSVLSRHKHSQQLTIGSRERRVRWVMLVYDRFVGGIRAGGW